MDMSSPQEKCFVILRRGKRVLARRQSPPRGSLPRSHFESRCRLPFYRYRRCQQSMWSRRPEQRNPLPQSLRRSRPPVVRKRIQRHIYFPISLQKIEMRRPPRTMPPLPRHALPNKKLRDVIHHRRPLQQQRYFLGSSVGCEAHDKSPSQNLATSPTASGSTHAADRTTQGQKFRSARNRDGH